MMIRYVNRNCCQGLLVIALICFLFGFTCQIFFHLLPPHHQLLSPTNNLRQTVVNDVELPKYIVAEELRRRDVTWKIPENFPMKNEIDINFNEKDVPNIVKSWRNAHLDWHLLLPTHNSEWERFGTPPKGAKLRLLVSKETLVTDYLTRFKESGLAAKYGHDRGELLSYTGCNVFSSSCVIHADEEKCFKDHLCKWSQSASLCVDGWSSDAVSDAVKYKGGQHDNMCHSPKRMGDTGFEPVLDTSECTVWSKQPAVLLTIDSESQAMFYHWWASWSSIIEYWTAQLKSSRAAHFFIRQINDPMFFHYFGIIADSCWRRIGLELNKGACFCGSTQSFTASQSRSSPGVAAKVMLDFLHLEEVRPPTDKVKIGIISRRRKRFILNEYALASKVVEMGYDCELLPLEGMTLYEQMRSLRSLDILIGIHGSALDNSVFLHKGSVMLQLLPYKVEHRVTFRSSAEEAGMKYMEWQLQDERLAFFHWDLMEQANSEKMRRMSKRDILDAGQVASDNRETTMFWINQDIIVPIHEWIPLVTSAAETSNAAARGVNVTANAVNLV